MAVPTHAYYTGMGPYFDGQAMGGAAMGFQNFNRPKGVPMYRSREVIIEGLPAGWSARVSKHSGQIYFLEQASGKTQYCVPKGYADRDPEGVVDLSNSTHGTSSSANGNEEEMADDLDDSMDQDGPDSPVAGPPNSIDPRNSRPAARQHRSGVKSDGAYDDVVDSAFRSAMDEYANYSDASEVSSNKAVWDDGSGYSLNDNAFSVSDTTNSTNDSPVFSSMHGRGGGTTGSAASTFLSGANSMLTTASGASDGLNPSSSATHGNINIHNYSSNGEDGGPMTQDSTPTPLDSQLYPQSTTTTSHQGSSGPPSTGIAMMQGSTLGPGEGAEHSSDYFLGAFTPASSQHSSSNDLR